MPRLLVELLRVLRAAILHEIPLVRDDHDAAAGLVGLAADRRVLIGRAGARVDDERDDVRVADRLLRAGDADHLDRPPLATRPGRRMPAVSTMRNRRRCQMSGLSIASRVVPGMSLTITRSSRSSRFTSDDLPTFGRPTIATRRSRSGVCGRRLDGRSGLVVVFVGVLFRSPEPQARGSESLPRSHRATRARPCRARPRSRTPDRCPAR